MLPASAAAAAAPASGTFFAAAAFVFANALSWRGLIRTEDDGEGGLEDNEEEVVPELLSTAAICFSAVSYRSATIWRRMPAA